MKGQALGDVQVALRLKLPLVVEPARQEAAHVGRHDPRIVWEVALDPEAPLDGHIGGALRALVPRTDAQGVALERVGAPVVVTVPPHCEGAVALWRGRARLRVVLHVSPRRVPGKHRLRAWRRHLRADDAQPTAHHRANAHVLALLVVEEMQEALRRTIGRKPQLADDEEDRSVGRGLRLASECRVKRIGPNLEAGEHVCDPFRAGEVGPHVPHQRPPHSLVHVLLIQSRLGGGITGGLEPKYPLLEPVGGPLRTHALLAGPKAGQARRRRCLCRCRRRRLCRCRRRHLCRSWRRRRGRGRSGTGHGVALGDGDARVVGWLGAAVGARRRLAPREQAARAPLVKVVATAAVVDVMGRVLRTRSACRSVGVVEAERFHAYAAVGRLDLVLERLAKHEAGHVIRELLLAVLEADGRHGGHAFLVVVQAQARHVWKHGGNRNPRAQLAKRYDPNTRAQFASYHTHTHTHTPHGTILPKSPPPA